MEKGEKRRESEDEGEGASLLLFNGGGATSLFWLLKHFIGVACHTAADAAAAPRSKPPIHTMDGCALRRRRQPSWAREGEGREGRKGVAGSGGKVDRLEERKQSAADDDDAEGSSRRRRRGRIILAAVWWMDGWMFGCENAIARFSSSSRRQAGRPSIS